MIKSILIVDDEPHILLLMQQTLEDFAETIVIHKANNGKDALALIKKEIPDLVFLDVMMPHLSGLEICEKVKQDPALKHIYVVLLTARAPTSNSSSSQTPTADLYLTKPFDPDQIVAVVEKLQAQKG